MIRGLPYNAVMRSRELLFLPLLLLPLGCGSGAAIYEAPQVPIQSLLSSVPDELRYEQPNVAPNENGWLILAKGFDKTPRLDQETMGILDRPGETLSGPKDLRRKEKIKAVFEKYDASMKATENALLENRVGVLRPLPGENSTKILSGLRVQLTLFTRRAALSLAAGNEERALRDYETSVKIVRQLSSAGAPMNYAVIATSLWSRVFREIRWAACHPKMTERGLLRLLAILPDENVVIEDFGRSIRSEFHQFVRDEVQRLRGPGGNSQVERDARESYRDFDSGWDQADAVAAQVLEGHERPFDRQATVASAAAIYKELLNNLKRPWNAQVQVAPKIVKLIEHWPVSRLHGDVQDSSVARAELANVKPMLMKAENPYGKFALWYFLPVSDHTDSAPFRVRTDLRATRIVIAARVFKARNRRLPESLDMLESSEILKAVPADPFADNSFQYDSSKGRLSSPGPTRKELANSRRGSPALSSQDYVWYCNDLLETEPPKAQPVTVLMKKRPLTPQMAPFRIDTLQARP